VSKTAVILQSSYIPWRGYFDLMADADVFVVYDDVQYTKNDWRNRNRIKTKDGLRWVSVPVDFRFSKNQMIQDVEIRHDLDWAGEHLRRIEESYGDCPFFKPLAEGVFSILKMRHRTLSELNLDFFHLIRAYLGITTPLMMSRDLSVEGSRTERLIEILKKTGADRQIK